LLVCRELKMDGVNAGDSLCPHKRSIYDRYAHRLAHARVYSRHPTPASRNRTAEVLWSTDVL